MKSKTSKTTAKDYETKVHDLLDSLPFHDLFYIADKVNPENTAKFIEIVKQHIREDKGEEYLMEITNDHKKLKKIKKP